MRKPLQIRAVLTAFLIGSCALTLAQSTSQSFAARNIQQTLTPEEIVERFEAPAMTSYTLGDGDEITVDVWGHPELSGHLVIGPDGKITVPVAGVIKVSDLTREDAQKAIANSLSHYYSDLAVTMRVDRYTSYRIYVLGRAGVPGILQFDTQPTLLDAVARAGTTSSAAGATTGLGRCAILRGRDQIVWVDMRALLNGGNSGLNLRLARNDMVYLPENGDGSIYVLGEVKHPGAFQFTPAMSFLDAFSQAGGSTEDASENKIEIIRTTSGVQREIRLSDLLAGPQQTNFVLQEGDIIYVPRRNMAKVGYVLAKTSPLSAFAVIATVGIR